MREIFLKTERIGFSVWNSDDINLADSLWGDPAVTRYICASGKFSEEDICSRLETEISNEEQYHVQYWPIFSLSSGDLIGCCGLRPHGKNEYEIGFHLKSEYWGKGYAVEAANAVIEYAFSIGAEKLFAGHNPNNIASQKLLKKLGFRYIGDEYYEPTKLYHPSYELTKNEIGQSDISIEIFNPSYTDEIIELALHFQNDGTRPSVTVDDQPDLRHIKEEYIDTGGSFWVARDNGRVVGSVGLMPYSEDMAVMKKFFVYEEYQGAPHHLGQQLFKRLIGFAKQERIRAIYLDTPKNTVRAHRFYEKAGFVKIDESDIPLKYSVPIKDCDFFMLKVE